MRIHGFLALVISSFLATACGGGSSGAAASPPPPPPPPGDTIAPSVSSNVPAAGAVDIARDGTVSVTFSEDILPGSVTTNSLTLGNGVSGSVSFDPNTNIATFTPDAPLALLTTYTVTLTTAVMDLAGNPLANDISWTFTTVDGAWGINELANPGANDTWAPQVSVDDGGNAIAIWVEDNGSGSGYFDIWVRRYTAADSTWGTATMIGPGAGFNIGGILGGDPQISFDSDGNAVAAWARIDGSGGDNEIMASRYTVADDTWSVVAAIGASRGQVRVPQFGFDGSGNAIAVWEHQETGNNIYSVRSSQFSAVDNTWSPAVYLENELLSARDPQIAVDTSGNAIAVWQQRTDDGLFTYDIQVSRYTIADDTWSAPQSIRNNPPFVSFLPQITMDSGGDAIVVWEQRDPGQDFQIWTNRFTVADGTWGTPMSIDAGTGDAYNAQIDVDAGGNVISVWQQRTVAGNDTYEILVSRYTVADGLWGTPTRIDTAAGLVSLPQIAVDAAGNATVVWEQDDGTGIYDVRSSRFSLIDGNWSLPVVVDTGAGTIFGPQISVNDSGIAVTVWEQDDETGVFDVLTNRFD
jgi:hypothetical protein